VILFIHFFVSGDGTPENCGCFTGLRKEVTAIKYSGHQQSGHQQSGHQQEYHCYKNRLFKPTGGAVCAPHAQEVRNSSII
jgi:hypothetical protein